MSTDPTLAWAIFQFDRELGEKRLVGVYSDAADANVDALALQNETTWVTVEPFEVNNMALYTSKEAATETNSADFDTPIHVTGEVR